MKMIKAAIGVLVRSDDKILITRRGPGSYEGFWEFPGGKLREAESPEAALVREIKEEVGLSVNRYQLLCELSKQMETYFLSLYCYEITEFSGEASCFAAQSDLRWVSRAMLSEYRFPEANLPLIQLLML
jgi:8-oxo-dGTP diphosphatase